MKLSSLPRKVIRGLPYLAKEIRATVSDRAPFFVAVPRTVHIWREAPCNAKCIMCIYGYYQGEDYRRISASPFTDEMMPQALTEIHELCGRGTLVSCMGSEPAISLILKSTKPPPLPRWPRQNASSQRTPVTGTCAPEKISASISKRY